MLADNATPALSPVEGGPSKDDLTRLAESLRAYAPYDGGHELLLPGVYAVRASRAMGELVHGTYKPSLCIVAQGAKSVFLGSEVYQYDASRMLMFSVELPVVAQVTQASPAEPFLGLTLSLDPQTITELALKVYPHGLPPVRENRGVCVGDATSEIVSAATRLVELIADPRGSKLIAPLVLEEIFIRLLCSPIGSRVAQIGQEESSVQRIAKAVDWVRDHFDQPMNVEALAEMVHMSPSTFHQHFKAVTSMSPLQFQKALRLREARRLMLSSRMDATTASRHVGYASASQFTREYGRLFGRAPSKDVAQLREQGNPPSPVA
jgi:AraC-like DNA-binding protein